MKDRMVLLMVLAICLVGSAQAAKCIIYHNPDPLEGGGPVPELQALMETLFGVGEVVQVWGNDYGRLLNTAAVEMEAAELIIITRRMSSDQFRTRADRAGVPNRWWDLDTPVITLSGYPPRDSRWNFSSASGVSGYTSAEVDVLIPDHPFLEETTGYPNATSVAINTVPWRGDTSTGTLIPIAEVICDSPDTNNRPVLVHFPGSGVTGVEDAPRSDFVMFSIGADTTGGGMDRGQYKRQTADCDQIMINIAYEIVDSITKDPTINPAPSADAGSDVEIYLGEEVQLAGVVTDEGSADGTSSLPGIGSLYWTQKGGPDAVTFSPSDDVLDPTVTFGGKGVYELMLMAYDVDGLDANDVVTILVKDHADEFIVGHWPLDGDALDATANGNDGTLMGTPGAVGGMPIYAEDAAVGTHSIDISDRLGLEAINSHDPNMPYIALGEAKELDFGTTNWTVSGWIKTTQPKGAGDLGKGTIFGNGGDQTGGHRYCLIVSEGTNGQTTLVTDADSNGGKFTTENDGPDNDGNWHLIVGVRDGGEIRIYRDGVLEGTNSGPPDDYDLSGTSQHGSYIGMLTDNRDSTLYKHLDGLIDDVRIYNYALPLDGDPAYDSILSLTAMGPIVASVDAGPDADFTWRPGWELALGGMISDNGAEDEKVVLWTTESGPGEATFVSPSDPASMVTFPAGGTYVLKLTVFDEGVTVESTVTITVIAPGCADVVADGLLLATDLDGDCRVGLSDLAIMLANWAVCNDPIDAACDWPF